MVSLFLPAIRAVWVGTLLTWTCASLGMAGESVPVQKLADLIHEQRTRVPEFRDLADFAQRNGLRVFLTGGSAASLGDFLKHKYLAAHGTGEVDFIRFADKLNNVLLPEQDLDIAITRADGTPETAADIEKMTEWLKKNYPYTIDERSRWDVIGLKTDVPAGGGHGPRIALLNNPDFARQNNDSLSIGMIELTSPPNAKDPIITDLIQTGEKDSRFLQDLAGDRIRFLESSDHMSTRFAREGRNPKILGAIRFLTKAFQFQKEISRDDLQKMKKIVAEFNPSEFPAGSYVSNWIQGKAKRLITHAYDPRRASQTIWDLGLTEKLWSMDPEGSKTAGTLNWWLQKDPAPLERKRGFFGKTAGELGITHVAHETDPLAARLITWRYDGRPRLLRSRNGVVGEVAWHGDGFYTKIGTDTAGYNKNSGGHMILMEVDPEAREGIDFDVKNGNLAIWQRGTHLRVVPKEVEIPMAISCAASIRQQLLIAQKLPPPPAIVDTTAKAASWVVGSLGAFVGGIYVLANLRYWMSERGHSYWSEGVCKKYHLAGIEEGILSPEECKNAQSTYYEVHGGKCREMLPGGIWVIGGVDETKCRKLDPSTAHAE